MKLFSPKTTDSRPIIDRVKESLFSVLYNYGLPDGAAVADLFCGVGSLGLEALSRGAEFVAFVEQDPGILATLKRNIAKAGFADVSKVVRGDAFTLGCPPGPGCRPYDLVFVDPPYVLTAEVGQGSRLGGLMVLLGRQVADNATVVVRTRQDVRLLDEYGRFAVMDRRRWATMSVTILRGRGI